MVSSVWERFYADDLSTLTPNPQSVWGDMPGLVWLVEAWNHAQLMTQPGIFMIPRHLLEFVGEWNEDEHLAATPFDDIMFFTLILSRSKDVLFTLGAVLYRRSGLQGSLSS